MSNQNLYFVVLASSKNEAEAIREAMKVASMLDTTMPVEVYHCGSRKHVGCVDKMGQVSFDRTGQREGTLFIYPDKDDIVVESPNLVDSCQNGVIATESPFEPALHLHPNENFAPDVGRFVPQQKEKVFKKSLHFSHEPTLQPIETAPKDGSYILLFGPSGYTTTPLRCAVCRYDDKFRPKNPWVDYGDDAFSDSGAPPTHWMPLPKTPRE